MFVISPTAEFYFNRYHCLEVGEMLTPEQCEELVTEIEKFPSKSHDRQQLKSPHWYAEPPSEKILDLLTDPISKLVGEKLFPTYSYVRKYLPGDILKRHTDLPACEFTVTIMLAESSDHKWPLIIPAYEDSYSTRKVFQTPGDGVIIKGCDVPHWREEFIPKSDGDWQYQGLFHFVTANGPNAHLKYNRKDKLNY